MRNYIQSGETIDGAAPYDRASGEGALLGAGLFGVATSAVLSGATIPWKTTGVYSLAKKSGDTPAFGAKLYWDNTNKYLTTTATSNTYIGSATAAALSGDATVKCRLNGVAI